MPEIFVPFGAVRKMLQEVLQLPIDADSAFEARLRQLSTMGVPRQKRSAANARLHYGLQEVAELAVALALINGRMLPATAARYVSERWDVFAPAAVAGAGDERPTGYADERPDRGGPYVVIGGNALSILGSRAMREKTPEPLAAMGSYRTHEDVIAALEGHTSASWINTSRFMPSIVRRFTEQAASIDDVWESLDRLRQSERVI